MPATLVQMSAYLVLDVPILAYFSTAARLEYNRLAGFSMLGFVHCADCRTRKFRLDQEVIQTQPQA